jgi:hypothetical protein
MSRSVNDVEREDLILGRAILDRTGMGSDHFDAAAVLARARDRVSPTAPRGSLQLRPDRRPFVVGASVLLVAFVAFAVVSNLPGPAAPNVKVIDTSWAYNYGSTQEIADASVLVVAGTVKGVVRQDQVPGLGYPQTIFALSVDRTIKGVIASSQLQVVQDGGQQDSNTWVELQGLPLMAPGDRVVLFLRPITRDGEALWVLVGGPEGLLKVTSANAITPWSDVHIPISPSLTVDALAAELH